MAQGFEITRLYATVVPKLSTTFAQDLRRQLSLMEKRVRGEVEYKPRVSQAHAATVTNQLNRLAKDRTAKIDVNLQQGIAKTTLDHLARDRKVKMKVEVDSSAADILSSRSGGSRQRNLRKESEGFSTVIGATASSIDQLGKGFNRLNDIAGFTGSIVSGVATVIGKLGEAAGEAAVGGLSMGKMFVSVGTSAANFAAVAGIVVIIVAMVAALALGTLALIGFAAAAVIVGAVVSAIGIAVGALGAAAAAAIPGFAALAGAAAVLTAALWPIVQAFQEFTNVQGEATEGSGGAANSVRDQARSLRSAAAAIRSAQRGVVDAQRSIRTAIEDVADATRSVRNANESYRRSIEGLTTAREDLNRAEQTAIENLEELRRQARDAEDTVEAAELRLIRAQERLAELNPLANDSTDYREALLDIKNAEEDLLDAREDGTKVQNEYAEAQAKGVQGAADVVNAQRRIRDAQSQVRDSSEAVADAERRLRDSREAVTRAEQDAAEARFRLRDAQLSYNDTLTAGIAATAGSTAAQQKLSKQFGELTKEGQAFFNELKGVYFWLKEISNIGQRTFLPGLTDAFRDLGALQPVIERAVAKMGRTLGDVAREFGRVLSSPAAVQAFDRIAAAADHALGAIGRAGVAVTKTLLPAMGRLSKAAKPLLDAVGDALVSVADGVGKFLDKISTPTVIKNFSVITREIGRFLGQISSMIGDFVAQASGNISKEMPKMINGILSFTSGLFAVFTAFFASGLMGEFGTFLGLLGKTMTLMANTGLIEAMGRTMGQVLVILGEGLVKTFSDPKVVDAFIQMMEMMPLVMHDFIAILPDLIYTFTRLTEISLRFLKEVGPESLKGTLTGLKLLGGILYFVTLAIMGFKDAMKDAWDGIKIAASGIQFAILAMYLFIGERFKSIKDFIDELIKKWQEFSNHVSRITTNVKNFVLSMRLSVEERMRAMGRSLQSSWVSIGLIFRNAINAIKSGPIAGLIRSLTVSLPNAFRSLASIVSSRMKSVAVAIANPLRFIVNGVLRGGLVGAFNTIASKLPGVPRIAMALAKFADGGIYPGYTPGRDVGIAAVSGGEAIMRPEWTRAMGKDYVNQMNAVAKRGGASAVKKAAGGGYAGAYASGGIVGKIDSLLKAVGGAATSFTKDPFQVLKARLLAIADSVGFRGNHARDVGVGATKKITTDAVRWAADKLFAGTATGGGSAGFGQGVGASNVHIAMKRWLLARFPTATANADTGRRDGGYHGLGRALDIFFRDGSERTGGGTALSAFNAIKGTFMKNIKELIWDFARGNAVWNGQNHFFTGPGAGPGTHNDHLHWAMKNGGLVSGPGSGTSDLIWRLLSNGEYVMSAAATQKIGVNKLNSWNEWGKTSTNSSPRGMLDPRTSGSFEGGEGQIMIDQSRTIEIDMTVTQPYHADAVINRINSLL